MLTTSSSRCSWAAGGGTGSSRGTFGFGVEGPRVGSMPGRAVGEAVRVHGGRVGRAVAVSIAAGTAVAVSAAGAAVSVSTGAGCTVAVLGVGSKGRVQVGTAVRGPWVEMGGGVAVGVQLV